jgi:hypothetical protein
VGRFRSFQHENAIEFEDNLDTNTLDH